MELIILFFIFQINSQSNVYPQIGSVLPLGSKPNYHDDNDSLNKCDTIKHDFCSSMQYNQTMVPTWLGLSSQNDANNRISDYDPLINLKCSNYLQMFLCTIYFPMCTQVTKEPMHVLPCKSLCLHVKNQCEKYMLRVQYSWPKDLSCDKLPEPDELCVGPENFSLDLKKNLISPAGENSVVKNTLFPDENEEKYSCSSAELRISSTLPDDGKNTDNSLIIPVTSNGNKLTCLSHCEANIFYRLSDKQFANHWQFIWSLICFLSSFLTVMAFFNNRKRFNYPERPIFYISLCYLLYSSGYLFKSIVGYEAASCHPLHPTSSQVSDDATSALLQNIQKYLISPGYETPICTGIYLILSYSKMASSMWWVVLGISWYLSTTRTWSPEGVESISSIFHMMAWSVPAIRVIISLILHKIDANELTGLCSIGNTDAKTFLLFEIIPMATTLCLGLIFMLVGFVSVIRVHKDLKSPPASIQGNETENSNRRRLEKLIAKLSVFTVLYVIPSISLIIGQIYEYTQMPYWSLALRHLNYNYPDCINPFGIKWSEEKCHPKYAPIPEIGMLKIFASLVIGITSGIWIWANKKTLTDIQKCCCGRSASSKKKKFLKADHQEFFKTRGQEPISSLSSGPTFTQLTTNGPSTTRFNSTNNMSHGLGNNTNSYYAYDISGINDSKKFASCV